MKFNRKAWLKSCINMNTELKKNDEKMMENRRNFKDIKLVTKKNKNESFSVRSKLSYNQDLFRKFISN